MNDVARAPSPFFFEDYVVGQTREFGRVTVDEADVLDFGRRYDPQPFHVDREAAARSIYGGLIASGWHTASLAMRLLVEHILSPESSLGSPGLDELRWPAPVRPGDTLSVRFTVLEAHPSRSKPDRGVVRARVEVLNQRREVVMSWKPVFLARRRDGAA